MNFSLFRPVRQTVSSKRWWDWPSAALLIAAMMTAANRLVATQWTEHLEMIENIVVVGALVGLLIGQSRFSARLANLLALAYGMFFIPWQLGIVTIQLPPDTQVLWSDRLVIIAGRLAVIISQIVYKEIVRDSLLFIVLMCILFWILGVSAGYSLTRHGNAWQAVLPAGLAMFVIHAFDQLVPQRAWYLAVYLFFALVLVSRTSYLHNHTRWQHSRTALPPALGFDFIRFTLIAVGILVIFSWTAPALADTVPVAERAFQPIKNQWEALRDRFNNIFASLRSTVGVVNDYYGSSVLLGRGNRLTDAQVFLVRPPVNHPSDLQFYWRARVYDTYNDGQWSNLFSAPRNYNPVENMPEIADQAGRWTGTFEVLTAKSLSTLFVPPQPLWVSRPAQSEASSAPDGSVELFAFRSVPSLDPGQSYQVIASISHATEEQLRMAGSEYPAHITDRYLRLPASITQRTRALAETITRGATNPYDQATAITEYLRKNIEYVETIPNRPNNQEAVDWFLFDLRRGFCNYYASAEIVLLRSIGIPARWAVGFAQGEMLPDGSFLVRQRDAHAWPEAYFPGLGWVEFEPTASRPALLRASAAGSGSAGAAESEQERLARLMEEEEQRSLRQNRERNLATTEGMTAAKSIDYRPIGLGLLVALALLLIGYRLGRTFWGWPPFPLLLEKWLIRLKVQPPHFLLKWSQRSQETPVRRIQLPPLPMLLEATLRRIGVRPPRFLLAWARRAELSPLARAYLEINYALTRLDQRPDITDTPSERAARLSTLIPPAAPPAQRLVAEYQLALFSLQAADEVNEAAARSAGAEIRALSYQEMFRRWMQNLQRPRNRQPGSN